MPDARPPDWLEMSKAVEEALAIPAERRAAYLDRLASAALREEVEGLIAQEERAERVLGHTVADLAGPLLDELLGEEERADDLVGREVGPYRIVREVGRGGMGQVYVARRQDADASFALKTLGRAAPFGLDAHEERRELRALARLEHPNAARFLDAGRFEDGTPYVVMDYVEGRPIDRYCREEGIPLRDRLRLFLGVCEAVSAAHSQLVIHRDIKPSNVLVREDGDGNPQVKLIDFGIAALLEETPRSSARAPKTADPEMDEKAGEDDTRTPASAEETSRAHEAKGNATSFLAEDLDLEEGPENRPATVGRRLTWAYASPEQVRGEDAAPAMDVYALGALLYTLVTGRPPLDTSGRPPSKAARTVLEEVPPSLSQTRETSPAMKTSPGNRDRVAAEGLDAPFAASDLNAVTQKALQKKPEDRYPSADQLAEDVRRHLKHRPVRAGSASAGYRATKFMRRNAFGLGLAGVVAALLLAAAGVSFYQAGRAAEEAARAETVKKFVVGLFEDADPIQGEAGNVTTEELLDLGAARLERQFPAPSELRAELDRVIGTAYKSLDQAEDAEDHLVRALETEQALHDGYAGEGGSARAHEAHEHLAGSLSRLAYLRSRQARYAEADSLHRRALQMRRQLFGPSREVSYSLQGLGEVARQQGDYERAEELLREGVAMQERLLASGRIDTSQASPGNGPEAIARFATLKGGLASTLAQQGRYDEAEPLMREVLALRRRAVGKAHPRVATAMNNLSYVLGHLGKFDEAERLRRGSLAIRAQVLGKDHTKYATGLSNLAVLMYRQDRYAEADSLLQRTLDIDIKQYGEMHPNVAYTLDNLAGVASARGALDVAEGRYRRALRILQERLGEKHPQTLLTLGNLGNTLYRQGKSDEAEKILREALRLQREALSPDHPEVAGSLNNLARTLTGDERCAEALPLYREAIAIQAEATGEDHRRTAFFKGGLGSCLASLGRYEEAESLLLEAHTVLMDQGARASQIESVRKSLHRLYRAWGQPQQAEAYASAE